MFSYLPGFYYERLWSVLACFVRLISFLFLDVWNTDGQSKSRVGLGGGERGETTRRISSDRRRATRHFLRRQRMSGQCVAAQSGQKRRPSALEVPHCSTATLCQAVFEPIQAAAFANKKIIRTRVHSYFLQLKKLTHRVLDVFWIKKATTQETISGNPFAIQSSCRCYKRNKKKFDYIKLRHKAGILTTRRSCHSCHLREQPAGSRIHVSLKKNNNNNAKLKKKRVFVRIRQMLLLQLDSIRKNWGKESLFIITGSSSSYTDPEIVVHPTQKHYKVYMPCKWRHARVVRGPAPYWWLTSHRADALTKA